VAEIKIPDNTKFHKNISIMITPATLPSQRCVEWLLLAERGCCWRIMAAVSGSWLLLADHGCCWRNMAAVHFAPLRIHTAGCRVFIFFSQLFLFSERQRIRRYAIRARVDVVL